MRSTRQLICVTALALTVFTQLLISQTPSPSHQSSNSAATAKASNGKVNCTDNGTYQNRRGETVRRPENCSVPPDGASAQCRDGSLQFQP